MAWREIDGLRLPVPVAGDSALELCNTRAGWGEASPKEYLTDLQHATVLAVDLELLAPAARFEVEDAAVVDPVGARRAYRRLLRVRADLYAVVTGEAAPAALDRLNADMLTARRQVRLIGSQPGDLAWSRDCSRPDAVVDVFAAAAERLLSSPAVRTVTACPGHGCGWVFVNPTHRRRWCSMQWCGNRAKARRHAARSGQ